mgnify:FL=1
MMLILISFWGLSTYQRDAFRKAYGLSEQVDLFNSNSTQVFNRLTRSSQEEIRRQIKENPDQFTGVDGAPECRETNLKTGCNLISPDLAGGPGENLLTGAAGGDQTTFSLSLIHI